MVNFPRQIASIQRMNTSELLDYVLAKPHQLSDPYYKDLAIAIVQRRADLAKSDPYNQRKRK